MAVTDSDTKNRIERLKAKANRLPSDPGVYIMKNSKGTIIYIGKAKALKNRVTQYFGGGNQHTQKVRQMVQNVHDFEYIICDSEFEALILENSLIKQNQPKYNILLKDDKGYHYIKITNDKWRRIETAKAVDKTGEFLGPYNSGFIVRETVEQARKIFKLPDCNRNFNSISKPCLNYHIGICDAPCRGKISHSDYIETVSQAVDYIKHGGKDGEGAKELTAKMEAAAENLDFELAAKYRDRIRAINRFYQKQKVIISTYKSEDIVAGAIIGEKACIEIFTYRGGRMTDKNHYFIDVTADRAGLYGEFLERYYSANTDIPQRIVIDTLPEGYEVMEKWLSELSGHKAVFFVPKQGDQKALLDMCLNNAAEHFSEKAQRDGRETSALNELALLLGLDSAPEYIEAYDISNTAGSENVAGMVVFRGGKPLKAAYKRFKIKSFSGQDDYRSMAEVLDRRFNEYEKGQDQWFSVLPDLILLDGGKGQLSAVLPVLKGHNIDLPVFGMVKDSKHRTRAIAAAGGDIAIKSNRRAFTLITNIQDEVHRFAIGYHKNRQSKALLSSELLQIEGIGKTRAAALLKYFKTMSKIKAATVEELKKADGMTGTAAKNIYDFYH